MAVRTPRIAWISAAVIAVALSWLWWNARKPPAPVDPNDVPWIGLPTSGMDATQAQVRMVINAGFRWVGTDSVEPLAFVCGDEWNSGRIKDRYIAHIGANGHDELRSIVLDVHGQRIDVSIAEESNHFHPPFPDSEGTSEAGLHLYSPAIQLHKSREALESIRASWNDLNLWQAPQDIQYRCMDGLPIFLEACVDGKYAARLHDCDPVATEASSRLWQVFNNLLPPPPKSEWRDANGNPVPDGLIRSLQNKPPTWLNRKD